MDERFLEDLYEAAVVPELWPEVLRSFQGLTRGAGAVLITVADGQARWVSSSADFDEVVATHFERFSGNGRTARLIGRNHAGFLRDIDIFTEAEMALEPVYADFLIPRGLGIGVATAIASPSGESFILHAERERREGPVDGEQIARLDRMRPHLARAMLLSARLDFERARGATQALEAMGLPAAVLDRSGRPLSINGLLAAMIPDVAQDRLSRLTLTNPAADMLLETALATMGQHATGAAVRSIPIAQEGDRPPLIVHLSPVRGAAHDVFTRASTILVVTPVVLGDAPSATVVQGLFDLTPAEARLAALIAAGSRPRDAAATLGVTEETARTTLKRVMAKTGLHRQAELVGLLRGARIGTTGEGTA
jgi:DNA-binding CsgD family transcriptional regulator